MEHRIIDKTAVELSQLVREGSVKPTEVLDAFFAQIDKAESNLHSYVTVTKEEAYKQAERIEVELDQGATIDGPLLGVPIAIKDNICTKDIKTTCSSKILSNFVPTYSATAIDNLKAAGAIIIGKTNMDEFGMGSTTETSFFGSTKNPHNENHVPGGSSGGSCAAVAAKEAACALGSDTGGSIRQPSSHCGVVGLKPTYGTVSRYGLIAYGSSLDQIGPIGKDVQDCATILEVISGWDKNDSTSIKREEYDFKKCLSKDMKGMKVGMPSAYFSEGLSVEVAKAVQDAADIMRDLGAKVEEFTLPYVNLAIPTYYLLASAEASSNLSRFDGVKYGYRAKDTREMNQMYEKTRSEGFGEEVKRRIMLGSFVLSAGYYDAYYLKALRTKALIKNGFDEAFSQFDLILGPTAPSTAPRLGESLSDPMQMYLGDIYTISANLAGLPGISIPAGKDSKGLPMGIQLMGDCYREDAILRGAFAYEQAGKERS